MNTWKKSLVAIACLAIAACAHDPQQESVKPDTPIVKQEQKIYASRAQLLADSGATQSLMVKGVVQRWKPLEDVKGAGVAYFDWQLQFNDSSAIPLRGQLALLKEMEGRSILLYGRLKYGPVNESPDAVQNRNAYRLDVEGVLSVDK